ncbi:MAG: hypothetical protein OEV43_06075, partial [Coriobacteriia bacterium]|nr:hypothetical protein [Coriobacteriia bacterium]
MRITVRVWQTALFVTVIVVAMLILSTSLLAGLGRSIRDLGREEQLKDATVIADSLGPYFPVTVESRAVLREEVRRVHNIFGDDVWVFDLDGVRIDHEGGMDAPPDNLEEAFTAGLADSPPYAEIDLAEDGLAVAATAIYDDAGRRTGVVVVAEATADARAVLDEAERQLRVASWVALAVAGLLGFAFSDFIGRRVKMLTRAASAIADGDFQQRLPKGLVPDEI